MLKIVESDDGKWNVVNARGEILATETTNAAAWRAVERLEVRMRGRKSFLFINDSAMTVGRK